LNLTDDQTPDKHLYIKWIKCLESFPDALFADLQEFDPNYDEGKVELQNQVQSLHFRIKALTLENDTLRDIMERKKHLLRSPSRRHRSNYPYKFQFNRI
jgi:hypothetical protein